jgi:hypothetical protein
LNAQHKAWNKVWLGRVGPGKARHGKEQGMARPGQARFGRVRRGSRGRMPKTHKGGNNNEGKDVQSDADR